MSTAIAEQEKGQGALFDYDALEEIHRAPIQRATEEIRHFMRQTATAVIKIGERLTDVHRRLPSIDHFEKYLEAELGWKLRSAYNFMRVFESFNGQSVEKIAPSALYLLSAPSTPKEAREAVLKLAADGNEVTHTTAKVIVETVKESKAEAQPDFFASDNDQDEIPLCLCGHPADHHANVSCDDCVCEQYDEAPIGHDDVTLGQSVIEAQILCLCNHTHDEHEEGSNCKICNCECFEVEKVNRENVETLAEITETVTTKTAVVGSFDPNADWVKKEGAADLLFDAAKIQINITIQPKKGDDRDVLLSIRSNEDMPNFEVAKFSQIREVLLNNFTMQKEILKLRSQLVAADEARKEAARAKKNSATAAPAAKTSTKTTTKTVTKKGKK